MNTTVTVDKAGRIVIPKTMRDELHLEAGDRLDLAYEGANISLRPLRSASPLRKEQGVWVFRGNRKVTAASTDKALENLRRERDAHNIGHGQ